MTTRKIKEATVKTYANCTVHYRTTNRYGTVDEDIILTGCTVTDKGGNSVWITHRRRKPFRREKSTGGFFFYADGAKPVNLKEQKRAR